MKKIIALCAPLACIPASVVSGAAPSAGATRPEVKMYSQRLNGCSEERLAQMLKAAGY
jgi:hypothetical protein